jgi:hypothetical protein
MHISMDKLPLNYPLLHGSSAFSPKGISIVLRFTPIQRHLSNNSDDNILVSINTTAYQNPHLFAINLTTNGTKISAEAN